MILKESLSRPARWCYVISVFFILIILRNTYAQEAEIEKPEVYLKNSSLYVRTHVADLFDADTRAAIASGMRQTYRLHFQMFDDSQDLLQNRADQISVRYDVWEQIYHLSAPDLNRQFNRAELFYTYISDSMEFNLGSTEGMNRQKRLQVLITFSRRELSDQQRNELRTWITEQDESQSQPALESDQGFSINLSGLLTIFFSKKTVSDLFVYRSDFFTLNSLKKDENTAQ